jgi:signal transduction histidine kinase/DNA-binding CsgD family transcriptional regulator
MSERHRPKGAERIARQGSDSPTAVELLRSAEVEDTAAAIEMERRRLAALLQSEVVDSLNLLLSQARAYEQSLATDPAGRRAVSVLASLARQILQQVRDLESGLHPTFLESLGLGPALEALSSQVMRAHGLHIHLVLERIEERLPPHIETALFRAVQDALERVVRHARASRVTIRLERQGERLVLSVADNGLATAGVEVLGLSCQRIEQLGGTVEAGSGPQGGLEVTISMAIEMPVQLTPRESEVIQLLTEGLTNKEIALRLSLSPRTVNFHLDNIYSKLGVNSRTEAAIYALRHGWGPQSTSPA